MIDKLLFRDVMVVLTAIPSGPTFPRSETLYESAWSAQMLAASRSYYEKEAASKILDLDVVAYLERVQMRLDQESNRVSELGLLEKSRPELILLMEEEFLKTHVEMILNKKDRGLWILIDQASYPEIKLMYTLLGRLEEGHTQLRKALADYVQFLGAEINQGDHDQALVGKGLSYVTWVESILVLKEKFDGLLSNCFDSNPAFEADINFALQSVVNQNSKSPEHVSLFVDYHLRQISKGVSLEGANNLEIRARL